MPLYIEKLEDAKHVFSHVEWHMQGFLIRVASLEQMQTDDWIFVDANTAMQEYPLPAAFRAYASYVNIQLGAFRETEVCSGSEQEEKNEITDDSRTLL